MAEFRVPEQTIGRSQHWDCQGLIKERNSQSALKCCLAQQNTALGIGTGAETSISQTKTSNMTSSTPAHHESCGCFVASDVRGGLYAQLCLPCHASALPQLPSWGLLIQGSPKSDLLLILPTQSRAKHSLAADPACEITFSALISYFKQN